MVDRITLARRLGHPWAPLAAALVLTLAAVPGTARAAMNFCAAPALQSRERTNTNPSVRALLDKVARHVDDTPKPPVRLHADDPPPPGGDAQNITAHQAANQELLLLRNAALAWRVSGDGRYLKLVDRFLAAWVTTYQPSFNPLDESGLDNLILAYDLSGSALPVKTRNATAAFLRKLGSGYLAQVAAQKRPLRGTFNTYWQSHRIKLIAMTAFALDDRRLINSAQRVFIEQIGNNINLDGATVDFAQHDALRYVTDDLEPLVMAALAAQRHNRNWLTLRAPSGASLRGALDWLTPYALGREPHDEFGRSSVTLEAKQHHAGAAGFGGPWDPTRAAALYYLATRLNSRYQPVALHLAPNPPAWLAVCRPLPE